jgi:molybdopterin biosynthesis enzyme
LRLASRLLTRLAGGTVRERWLAANLSVALPPNGPREFYQPARLEPLAAGFIVHPLEWKGSADLYTLAQANALILRPENQPALPQASLVRVMEL